MKIRFIRKLVLLILSASILTSCIKHPSEEKKDMAFNSYTEHVVKNHLLIRQKLRPYADSIEIFARDKSFEEFMEPLMLGIDTIISNNDAINPISRQDSLLYAMSMRLMLNYKDMLHRDFAEIYFMVDQNPNSPEMYTAKIDSIKLKYFETDKLGVQYFNRYIDSTLSPLVPFKF